MRVALLALSTLVVAAGCGTLRRGHRSVEPALSEEEVRLAQALAHYSQGLIHEVERGRGTEDALTEYAAAAELDPTQHRIRSKMAFAALSKGDADKAIKILEESCARKPDDPQRWIDLAVACQFTERLEQAIAHFRRAIELSPSEMGLYAALGRLHFRRNEDQQAFAVVDQGIRATGKKSELLEHVFDQARLLAAGQNFHRAAACFEFIAEREPEKRNELYFLLGELHLTIKNTSDAKRYYSLATQENNPLPESFIKLALLYLQDNPQSAVQTLETATNRIPDNVHLLFSLGYLLNYQKRFADAVRQFERIVALSGENTNVTFSAEFYLQFGAAYERLGQYEKAETVFEQGIGRHPKAHEVLNYLAYMWAERGVKLDKALEYIKRALVEQPDNAAYIDTLGWIYFQNKEYEKALAELQRAYGLMSEDPTIADHVGDALEMLKRSDEALSYWKKSFQLDPQNEKVAEKLKSRGVDLEALGREAKKQPATAPH
ncbi:MAG: tetratricopeptide repeat protein [Kiritimatiellia bacterium]